MPHYVHIPDDGEAMYYAIHGNGTKKLLFIMGFGSTCKAWQQQVDYFEQLGSEYTVCVFDHRGVGMSTRASRPDIVTTTSRMAKDVATLLYGIGWWPSTQVHVAGISMGGMIAMELAAQWPERLASMVLINTHAGKPSLVHGITPHLSWLLTKPGIAPHYHASISWTSFMKFVRLVLTADIPTRTERALELLYAPDLSLNDAEQYQMLHSHHTSMYSDSLRPALATVIAHGIAVLTHYTGPEKLAKIQASGLPVAVLVSAHDALICPTNGAYLAKALDGALYKFKDAGHGVNMERADIINETMHTFLTQVENEPRFPRVGPLGPLGSIDRFFFKLEQPNHVMTCAGCFIVQGNLSLETLQETMVDWTLKNPVLRQSVKDMVWTPHIGFDPKNHVRMLSIPSQCEVSVDAILSELMEHPLPSDEPLWDIHLVHDAPKRRSIVVSRVHHTVADGAGGVKLLRGLVKPVSQTQPTLPEIPQPTRLTMWDWVRILFFVFVGIVTSSLKFVYTILFAAQVFQPDADAKHSVHLSKSWRVQDIRAACKRRNKSYTINDFVLTAIAETLGKVHGPTPWYKSNVPCMVPLNMRYRFPFLPADVPYGNHSTMLSVLLPIDTSLSLASRIF